MIDTIVDNAAVIQNIESLIKATKTLGVPVLATEQEKLGEAVPRIKSLLSSSSFRKLSFSGCQDSAFMNKLRELNTKTVIVCGIETHICVIQTVLDLLKHHQVLVVRDATSSHALIDRETAIERMKEAGAVMTTTEAVIYELTEKAGTEKFRKILEIVKERRALNTYPK